jgi:hypothetical protein
MVRWAVEIVVTSFVPVEAMPVEKGNLLAQSNLSSPRALHDYHLGAVEERQARISACSSFVRSLCKVTGRVFHFVSWFSRCWRK